MAAPLPDLPAYRLRRIVTPSSAVPADPARLLDSAAERLVHVKLDRVSPLAVPVLVMIGRESVPQGAVDDELLLEAETLAGAAMRIEPAAADDD